MKKEHFIAGNTIAIILGHRQRSGHQVTRIKFIMISN
jgi:hypothetical protein